MQKNISSSAACSRSSSSYNQIISMHVSNKIDVSRTREREKSSFFFVSPSFAFFLFSIGADLRRCIIACQEWLNLTSKRETHGGFVSWTWEIHVVPSRSRTSRSTYENSRRSTRYRERNQTQRWEKERYESWLRSWLRVARYHKTYARYYVGHHYAIRSSG